MFLKDKAYRLFDYISQVYSLDLPVIRDISEHKSEVWWQADLVLSEQCKIKEFDVGGTSFDDEESLRADSSHGIDAWLTVTKRQYAPPPEPPDILADWLTISLNPTKEPSPKATLYRTVSFDDDADRVAAFEGYKDAWMIYQRTKSGPEPTVPQILDGWIESKRTPAELPTFIYKQTMSERFDANKERVSAFSMYCERKWKPWADEVLPLHKANLLYDELFSLYQRLGVEGDRFEVLWGHVFLAWKYDDETTIYYPLLVTPVSLSFDPQKRTISMFPSQTVPPRVDIDCLLNLNYPLRDELIRFVQATNSDDAPPDVWSHNQMKGFASTVTAYLSKEPVEKTNQYSVEMVCRPPVADYPSVYNAPLIFVRERMRRLWVDDAKKVAEAIYSGVQIPPFIESLVADPRTEELPNPADFIDNGGLDEDKGELLLPLEYNAQQEEIVKRLRNHFGALVQGPPGTGKSHTIANLVSSLLARGKRVLVTSQTQNALKVLRDYIPQEIRSLCVSQLGDDIDAKRQLNDAVDSIGKKLAERNSKVVEHSILTILNELQVVREEQSRLHHQIRDWVELDSCKISLDGETSTALRAARECSDNREEHSWFPDKISPDAEPPLDDEQLMEMCELLKELTMEDRQSVARLLPAPERLLTPAAFLGMNSEVRHLSASYASAEDVLCDWSEVFDKAQPGDVENSLGLLRDALVKLNEVEDDWQIRVLCLIASEEIQAHHWKDILNRLSDCREAAWKSYRTCQGYEIVVESEIRSVLDVIAAFDELGHLIAGGKKPTDMLARITMSKSAKAVYRYVKVDGHSLLTNDRVEIGRAYFTYLERLRRFQTIWNQAIEGVNGPPIIKETAMPLAGIDEQLRRLAIPIKWGVEQFPAVRASVVRLGCRRKSLHTREDIENCVKALHAQIAKIKKDEIERNLANYRDTLLREAVKEGSHPLWSRLVEATKGRDVETYTASYAEVLRLTEVRRKADRLDNLRQRLRASAPLWTADLENRAQEVGRDAIRKDWAIAWRWSRLNEWLNLLHAREGVESLQGKLARARRREKELIVELVKERTWQRQIANVEDYQYRALTAWANAMQRYGRGTGKHAQKWLAVAAKAMIDAVGAVPAWIMPLHRVVQSFPASPGVFDVIIVDEASQCDLRALTVLFRGKKVLVVGDPEQISPSNVGVEMDKVFALINQLLVDVPYRQTFTIANSLYEITKAIPRMDRILLTEHFRCVPEIIAFNNRLCPSYAEKLEPLRQPNPREMLHPCISTVFVDSGYKSNADINEAEAKAVVEAIVKCCKDDKYATGGKNNRKRTMGVISLLGEKQAKHISDLLAQHLDEVEREQRKIICGDAYAFQGDERDVMFLSLVIAPNALFASLMKDADRQRFNVATSRARDQVFLFHSVRLDDMKNPQCMRYRLLEWYLNPPVAEMEHGIAILKQKADSEFEIEVGERIIRRGFKVIPQYRPFPNDFNYRIDLVIQGRDNRVAVECDGDRWHGEEKWEQDQRREAQLRRAGWKFWRISGSTFYRGRAKALESLWGFLEAEGIKPFEFGEAKTDGSRERDGGTRSESSEEVREDTRESRRGEVDEAKKRQKTVKVSGRWQTWRTLAEWCKANKSINTFWFEFAEKVASDLKAGNPLTAKQKENMGKLWLYASQKGFRDA